MAHTIISNSETLNNHCQKILISASNLDTSPVPPSPKDFTTCNGFCCENSINWPSCNGILITSYNSFTIVLYIFY